jgi:membrane peptidoglycan carboxypeptidase
VSTPRQPAKKTANKAVKSRPAPPASSRPKKRKRHWLRGLIIIFVVLAALGVGAFALAVSLTTVPSPNEVSTSEATIVYWADGQTELGRLGEATRRSVALADVPLDAQHAVLAAEDRSFYEHGGISPLGIGRAVLNNLQGGSTQGGSTITQQYAKNAYLTQDRSWSRKAKELLLAFKLETVVSKDQILEDYLNTIYFGRGAYGIEAASIAYFGTTVENLDVSQAAVLAAVIKSPNGLAPEDNLPALKARWTYVLDSMVEQGWLTPQQRKAARFPEINEQRAGNRLGGQTGFLLQAVTDQLIDLGFDETEIQRGGLRITSTFDQAAQKAATIAVRKSGPDANTEGLRIGLAAVRPGTGEVVAMYAGKNFIDDQINNATREFAQAGSTFKPFALAAAFEQGVPLGTELNGDSPSTVNGYTFSNYGDKSYGPVTLLQATEFSINSAYVQLESEVGVDAVADTAIRAGVPETTPGLNLDSLDLTFVLGTASPSGLSMANAYATFAASGVQAETTYIKSVLGFNGGLLYEYQPKTIAAFEPEIANSVSYTLNKVVTDGTAFAAQKLGRPAAAKTGTTDENKSAWFVGYTPQLATAVLMAKEDASGLPVSLSGTGGLDTVTGGSYPAAIWTAFMTAALQNEPVLQFAAPTGELTKAPDCPLIMPTDGTPVPSYCPTPSVMEFGPEPTVEASASTEPIPTESAPEPISPGDEIAPDPGEAPAPSDGPPAPPIDEAVPG